MTINDDFTCDLKLRYKGERTWLHGTDLFDEILNKINTTGPVSLRIYKVMASLLSFRILEENGSTANHAAIFTFQQNGVDRIGVVNEIPGSKVSDRYAYNEEKLVDLGNIKNDTASIGVEKEYSFIEKIVALNKAMLNHNRGMKINWRFTRIDLQKIPNQDCSLRLLLATKPGGRLVRTVIYANNDEVGNIFFSEIKE